VDGQRQPVPLPAPTLTHCKVLPAALDLEKIIDRRVSRETSAGDGKGCLLWQGSVNNRGLPKITINRWTSRSASRLQYIRHHGPIPQGKTIGWSCGNRRCLEPSHLMPAPWSYKNLMHIAGSSRFTTITPRGRRKPRP
jgi:hypothetical protein